MAQGNTKLARRLLWFAAFVNVALLLMLCPLAVDGAAAVAIALLLAFLVDGFVGAYCLEQGLLFELQIEHRWKRVCGGIGFTSEARSYRRGIIGAANGEKKTIYPKLREVYGTHEGWTGIVTFFDGQTIQSYSKHADAFALAFNVPFISFDLSENGLIRVRAGKVPVPNAYDHPGSVQTVQAPPNRALSQQALRVEDLPKRC